MSNYKDMADGELIAGMCGHFHQSVSAESDESRTDHWTYYKMYEAEVLRRMEARKEPT